MVRTLLCAIVASALALLVAGCIRPKDSSKTDARREKRASDALDDKTAHAPRWRIAPICIDPGHGGRDSGTVGVDGTLEKTLVLDVAHRVRDRLEAEGATVVMTRDTDRFISLARRAAISNDAGAGLFVSIHANGFYKPDVHGFELYYFTGCSSNEAPRAADAIRAAIAAATDARDRGVRSADYSVLAATDCPAVLVEVGYLSNPGEAARLAENDYRQRIADAIADGIIAFGVEPADQPPEAHP